MLLYHKTHENGNTNRNEKEMKNIDSGWLCHPSSVWQIFMFFKCFRNELMVR
jgi:hypothetical protein